MTVSSRVVPTALLLLLLCWSGIDVVKAQVVSSPAAESAPASSSSPLPVAERDVAASVPEVADPSSVTSLQLKLKSVETKEDLSAEEKTRLLELLKRGVSAAERASALRDEAARLTVDVTDAPKRRDLIKMQLDQPIEQPPSIATLQRETTAEKATGELRVAEAALAAARQQLQEQQDQLARLRERPDQIRNNIAETKKALVDIEAGKQVPAMEGKGALAGEIRRAVLGARQRMRNAEVSSFNQQMATHDQRLSLLSAEIELSHRVVAVSDAKVAAWQQVVQMQRAREAAETAREAKKTEADSAQMPANVRSVAEQASLGAAAFSQLTTKDARITERLAKAQAQLQEVDQDLTAVRQRVAVSGLNETIGLVLRKRRQSLPTLRQYRTIAAQLQAETAWASGLQIDAEHGRAKLIHFKEAADALLRSAEPPLGPVAMAYYQPHTEELLRQIKDTADKIYEASSRYIRQLGRLDNAERQLVSRAETFERLINEHLLWIRSSSVMSATTVDDLELALRWFFDSDKWGELSILMKISFEAERTRWLAAIAVFVLLVCARPWLRRVTAREGHSTLKVRTDRFGRTIKSLCITVAIAAVFPLAIFIVGWQLPHGGEASEFSAAIGAGLESSAFLLFGFSFLGHLLRDGGVGDLQFRWSDRTRRSIRRNLRWLLPFVVIVGGCIAAVEAQENEAIRASLGRVAFVFVMIVLSAFVARMLRPRGALMEAIAEATPDGVIVKFQYLWIGVAAGAPITLAGLSIAGYHYSALQLQDRLQATAWLIVLLVIASETMLRWLFIARRRMVYQQAVEERFAEWRARQEAAGPTLEPEANTSANVPSQNNAPLLGSSDPEENVGDVGEPEVSADDLEAQAGNVVRTVVGIAAIVGLWGTWADVLPALNVLNDIVLWQSSERIDGVTTAVPVTLVDAALTILVGALAYVGAKNLPGALELLLLNQTPLDAGAKYAFTSLLRYVIVGVGVTVVFGLLGMQWSELQWLVAALSVGLGFGLQEIVANFVSGIILLFERPIRVGDIVTVNGSTGTVSRIQIRATTLIDFDKKELIMPNKVFITGEVLNWTLTDHTNRILIPVGVAYGSDTRAAMDLLLEAANENPEILTEPAPVASFEGFGDSALNLFLRCYKANMDGRLNVITALHNDIARKMSAAGIEIAFPQRDVHLHPTAPLEVRVTRDDGVAPLT
jgi:potassium-dependent mechanosensitive channel